MLLPAHLIYGLEVRHLPASGNNVNNLEIGLMQLQWHLLLQTIHNQLIHLAFEKVQVLYYIHGLQLKNCCIINVVA